MNLSLFSDATSNLPQKGEIWAPQVIIDAMKQGATLAISFSGGKDSQALLTAVVKWYRQNQFTGPLYAIHADLGRAEWQNTEAHVKAMCERAGVELRIVQRAKGDLMARFEERIEATQAKADATGDEPAPFWPDAQNRYCTSHLKGGPIDIQLRKPVFWPDAKNRYCTSDLKRGPIDGELRGGDIIISAEGVRADESPARAKKPVVEIRAGITASSKDPAKNLRAMTPEEAIEARAPGQRVALNWRPLLLWSTEDVWRECGTSSSDLKRRQMLYKSGNHEAALAGWTGHEAYIYGNKRLSCALCVLADKNDLTNGANHNPDIYRQYLELERRGGATFKNGWSLLELEVEGEAAEVKAQFLASITPGATA